MFSSRRNFIKNSALSALALPFLESLPVNAQVITNVPPRIIFLTLPHGQFQSEYFPKSTTPMTVGPDGMKYASLASISGPISNVFANRIDSFRNKINIIQGLDVLGSFPEQGDHKQTAVLCSSGPTKSGDQEAPPVSGYSVDTILSLSPTFYTGKPTALALRAAYDTYGYNAFFSFNKTNGISSRNSYIRKSTYAPDPGVNQQIFTKYFSSVLPGATPAPASTEVARGTALNNLMNTYSTLSKSARLSSRDKIQVQQHMDLINKLALSLNGSTTNIPISGQCTKPNFAATTNSNQEYEQLWDLFVSTLNCQMTQLIVFGFGNFVDPISGVSASQWHQEGGHLENLPIYRNLQGWIFDRVNSLLTKMDSIREINGLTMLDNSLVVVLNQHAYENGHQTLGYPVFMAGSLGGRLRTGYYIDYRQSGGKTYNLGYNGLGNNTFGRPYNNLFVSLFNALKIPTTEYERDGLVGFGEYNQAAYSSYGTPWANYLTTDAKRASLPFLLAGS